MDTLELVLDETLLNDEPGCESKHAESSCSVSVTHRGICCVQSVNVCTVAATRMEGAIARGALRCGGCRKNISECWRVVPI